MIEIEMKGWDEIEQDIQTVEKEMPYARNEVLKKSGRKFINECKDKTPYRAKDKKHIRDRYKLSDVKRTDDTDRVETTNTAPHFHLIERGHIKKNRKGEEVGFVPGVHMVQRTADEFEDEFSEIVGKLVDKMIRKINK